MLTETEKKITDSRKKAQILADDRKSHRHPLRPARMKTGVKNGIWSGFEERAAHSYQEFPGAPHPGSLPPKKPLIV